MIVDTSALIAILMEEPEAEHFARTIIRAAPTCYMSVANYLEAALRVDRINDPAVRDSLDDTLKHLSIELIPLTVTQAKLARQANLLYGKGTGHPAGLNYGDCFAYALAKDMNLPLLFKGGDFAKTDIKVAA